MISNGGNYAREIFPCIKVFFSFFSRKYTTKEDRKHLAERKKNVSAQYHEKFLASGIISMGVITAT